MSMITVGHHLIAVERAHSIESLCDRLAAPLDFSPAEGPLAMAVVSDSPEGLAALRRSASAELRATGDLSPQADIAFARTPCGPEGLALLFPGQGAQYPGMLSGFLQLQPFADILGQLDQSAAPVFGRSLKDWFFGDPADPRNALEGTHAAQASLGFCSAALARLLGRFGVKARFAAGHSYGELPALWQGGCFGDDVLFQATHARGQVMAQAAARLPSGLAAIGADEATVEALLRDWPGLQIANLNSPRQTVIGGAQDQLAALSIHCQNVGLRHAPITGAAAAFHTAYMSPALGDWAHFLGALASRGQLQAPKGLAVYANVTAEPYANQAGQEIAQLLYRQVTSRVRWADTCRRLHQDGARVFVEVGPGQVLTKLVGQNLADQPHHAYHCDPRGTDAPLHFARLLAQLAAHGIVTNPSSPSSTAVDEPHQGQHMIQSSERMVHAFLTENSRIVDRYLSLVEHLLGPSSQRSLPDQALMQMLDASTRLTNDHLSANERLLSSLRSPGQASAYAPDSPAPIARLAASTPPTATAKDSAHEEAPPADVSTWLRQEISTLTGFPPEAIDAQARFDELGIDSLAFMDLYRRLNARHPIPDELADQVFACRSIGDLVALVHQSAPAKATAPKPSAPASASASAGQQDEDLASWFRQQIARATGFAPEAIDLDTPLEDLGIDSLARTELFERLAAKLPAARGKSVALFEATTAAAMIALLTADSDQRQAPWPEALVAVRNKVVEELRSRARSPAIDIDDDTRFSALQLDGFERALLWESTALRLSPYRLAGEALISVGSVREGMDLLSSIRTATPEGSGKREPSSPPLDRLQRYLQVEMPRTLPDHPLPAQAWLLGPAGAELTRFADAMAAAGIEVRQLHLDAQGWRGPLGQHIPLEDAEALAHLLASHEAGGPLFFLTGRTEHLHQADDALACVDANGVGLFSLAKALESRPALMAAHGHLGVLLAGSGSLDVAARGVARSLTHEWRKSPMGVSTIALEASTPGDPALAARLLLAHPGKHDMTLRDGKLYEHIADVHQEVDQGDVQKLELTGDSVVLLFGGAVGIGAEIGIDLASRYGLRVVALGRTAWQGQMPYPHVTEDAALAEAVYADLLASSGGTRPEMATVQQTMQSVRRQRAIAHTAAKVAEAGGRFVYLSADVTNLDDVEHAIARIRQQFGGIDMVVHAAGLVEDRTVATKSIESFRRVLHTKARSALYLRQALNDAPPRYVAFFSSLVSHTGNAGQTDYCAGNEVLNALALEWAEASPDSRVIAFLWSVWTETGLAGRGVQQLMEKHMLTGISSAEGARRFHAEFTRPTGPHWVLITSAKTLDVMHSGALLN
ncbi:MAG: SDR family NAD(P)-dependent oxidoreductase [Rubrivivax sp.]|nr:MAG: SDR family NAD(P)-dependent oxidoreductase [Rubrivivax sp.]